MEFRTAHTADLDAGTLSAVRALLLDAFQGEFGDDDWDHSLGGVHVIGTDGDDVVGHACVVLRRLVYDDRALRTGYVEAVAVRADRRRRGYANELMARAEQVVRRAYDLGALSATDDAIALYSARGWQRWRGTTWALTPAGRIRTEDDDDAVFVLPVTLDVDTRRELTCDWRDGDPW